MPATRSSILEPLPLTALAVGEVERSDASRVGRDVSAVVRSDASALVARRHVMPARHDILVTRPSPQSPQRDPQDHGIILRTARD
eukprot:3122576-Prymnesium_polylepis.1